VKEGVSYTYKKFAGYSPIFGYLGRDEGYLINCELRKGSQHCQKGTPEFLARTIENSRMITDEPLLIRMDSGNDSLDNVKIIEQSENTHYIIKRNLRRESVDEWLDYAKKYGVKKGFREGKEVYYGFCDEEKTGFDSPLKTAYAITVRNCKADGQWLIFPEIEVELYWTDLNCTVQRVIQLYHEHGTSEQFHSEVKTDMGLERFPSGKFSTNQLILSLGMVSYNCLRLAGQSSLREEEDLPIDKKPPKKKKVARKRLRTVIQDIMYLACRLTCSHRRYALSLGKANPWFGLLRNLYIRFSYSTG